MERRSNYDITRDRLERDFLQYDQEAMLRRVPLRHDADYLYLTFLRREYRIDRKTGCVEWSDDGFQTANHAGHDEVGTIFDYLCCADPSVPLTGEYVSVNQLDGVVTGTTLGNDMFEVGRSNSPERLRRWRRRVKRSAARRNRSAMWPTASHCSASSTSFCSSGTRMTNFRLRCASNGIRTCWPICATKRHIMR